MYIYGMIIDEIVNRYTYIHFQNPNGSFNPRCNMCVCVYKYIYIYIYIYTEVELNISSYLDVSTNCIFFKRAICLYSKQLFFNGNAYQKHTICENTTAKMQIIP